MKKIVLLLVALISFNANAKFVEGTVKFNDGHEEKGLIKSFLEEKWFFQQNSKSLERNLNLDDKDMIFKKDKDSETKKISINDVNQVTLINDDGGQVVLKVIFLRELKDDGTLSKTEQKVYLPLLRAGKINLYGFKYVIKSSGTMPYSATRTRDEIFYYQNSKENYAINYGNMDEALEGIIFGGNMREKLSKRMINPLRELFKDCPKIIINLDATLKPIIDGDKEAEMDDKRLRKEFRNLPKEKRNDLVTIHAYDFYMIEKLITEYENCN